LVARAFSPCFKWLISQPFLANSNTSPSIRLVGNSVRVGASLFYALPNSVQPTIRISVLGQSLFSSAWSAIQALRLLIASALKVLVTPDTGKDKVFSPRHDSTPKLHQAHYAPRLGYCVFNE
jgi:hypothetical protein